MEVLKLENLSIWVQDNPIVKDVNLRLEEGRILFIVGPNGSGKTTLLRGIAGYPGYTEASGRVLFCGEDLTGTSIDYRVSKGLVLAHQIPPKVSGVRTGDLLRYINNKFGRVDIGEIVELLSIGHLLDREFGRGFSGGELKRVELATVLALKPKLALVDEPDSGVDVDSVMIIANGVRKLVEFSPYRSVVVVTHTALLARFLRPTDVCIMESRTIAMCGGAEVLDKVVAYGFKGLARRG